MAPLYEEWVERDKYFARVIASSGKKLEGIRILGQDPVETVFSFICSANNHIRRITSNHMHISYPLVTLNHLVYVEHCLYYCTCM